MSCVYPIDAWRAASCNESGKRGIVFRLQDGFSDQPIQVPCGHCVGCALDRARCWTVRMYHESTQHERNCFVTLTYQNAPPRINKRDLQLFFKRLRRSVGRLRYFACGEYGSVTRRPHYHAVIFGEDFRNGEYAINDTLYGNPWLQHAWGHGLVSIGELTVESCAYVAGYCTKKVGDADTFNIMSRRPGIGRGWLSRYKDDIVRTGCVVINGNEYQIPSAYLRFEEESLSAVKEKRRDYFNSLSIEEKWQRRISLRGKEANRLARLRLRNEVI